MKSSPVGGAASPWMRHGRSFHGNLRGLSRKRKGELLDLSHQEQRQASLGQAEFEAPSETYSTWASDRRSWRSAADEPAPLPCCMDRWTCGSPRRDAVREAHETLLQRRAAQIDRAWHHSALGSWLAPCMHCNEQRKRSMRMSESPFLQIKVRQQLRMRSKGSSWASIALRMSRNLAVWD